MTPGGIADAHLANQTLNIDIFVMFRNGYGERNIMGRMGRR
jgi:hypothetical protein